MKNSVQKAKFLMVAGLTLMLTVGQVYSIDYSYAKEIRARAVYDNSAYFQIGVSIPETPVGVNGNAEGGTIFLGTIKNCSWAIARCDQGQVGFTPAKAL